MNPRVSGISGPFQGATFSVASGEVSIGRDPSNHLWISDLALSRQHCLLMRKGDQFIIRDLGSRNGTSVNGMSIDEVQLQHGDQISIGESVLMFLLEGGEEGLQRSEVEFTETKILGNSPVLLQPEDAHLEPDKFFSQLPQTARWACDLNALLKLATRIGGIWDLGSLEWQLLGFIFDVVPAERGAILLFEHSDEFSSAVAWARVRG